jgi:HD-GYP domain-containing protein (c-di-GMP phosphodiesterase class II)
VLLSPQRRAGLSAAVAKLAGSLANHDPSVAGHCLRVCRYAGLLAVALGLDTDKRRQLNWAARLHDLGKIALPRAILLKSEPLTPDEYRRLQEHGVIGECLIAAFIGHTQVRSAVRGYRGVHLGHHHAGH